MYDLLLINTAQQQNTLCNLLFKNTRFVIAFEVCMSSLCWNTKHNTDMSHKTS